MGLFGSVFDDGLAFGEHGCEHDVDGRADRHHVKIDMRADEALGRFGMDKAAFPDGHLGAQCFKALDVLVNGPDAAKVAAARHSDFCMVIFSKKRAN